MLSLIPQHKQEKQLKDLEAARMKWSSWAVTRAGLRENSCELDTSSVQYCPHGVMEELLHHLRRSPALPVPGFVPLQHCLVWVCSSAAAGANSPVGRESWGRRGEELSRIMSSQNANARLSWSSRTATAQTLTAESQKHQIIRAGRQL